MVKKKNKKLVGIVGIILALALVFFVTSGNLFAVSGVDDLDSDLGQCSGRWTSFSIDDVTVNDENRIRVMGIAKGSECLSINLKPSKLNSYLDDEGLQATKSIIGNIKLKEYTKTFPIDRQTNVYGEDLTYKSIEVGSFNVVTGLTICSINSCKSRISEKTIDTFSTGLVSQTCNCIYPGSQGISGDFSSARSYGDFKVDVNLGGKTEELSRTKQSVWIGNNYVEYVGVFGNFDKIYPPQYDARLIYSNWELVNDGTLNGVEQKFSDFKRCFESGYHTSSGFETCKNIYNNEVSNILTNKLEQYKTDMSNVIYDANLDKNNLYVSLKATPYPAFILDLDAESVGIIALEGKPQITQCISHQDLKSGDNEIVNFRIKNNANVDGVEFYSSIKCNQGAKMWSTNFNIDGLETKTISAEINPVNPNEGTLSGTCKLTVSDLKSGNFDSCQFGIDVTYESGIICEPDSLSCDDNLHNVLKCSSDGKNTPLFKECEYGCEYIVGGAKCRGEPPIPPILKCESCEDYALNTLTFGLVKSCKPTIFQNTIFCMFSFVKLILVPVVFLFALLLGGDLFKRFKSIRKNEMIVWILSFSVAIFLATIVYLLFWVGIILTILFLVIKIGYSFIPLPKTRRRR